MNDLELFQSELCTLRRDYFVALAVLRDAIKCRTAQYERDRAALAQKYGAHIVDATPCPEIGAATALPRDRRQSGE